MRWVYSFLLYLIAPLVFVRLWYRGIRAPAYRSRWGERFGHVPRLIDGPRIWVHAVSVGETIAAAPMIRALQSEYPQHAILVTTTTPTGSQQVGRLFSDTVEHFYLPYDLPHVLRRFLGRINPDCLVVMETELWPNLFHQCRKHHIPVTVVNARLSPGSLRGYQRLSGLVRETLQGVKVLAQTGDDAQRFELLGAKDVQISGNLKFDLNIDDEVLELGRELRKQLGSDRLVWIAASTHQGEDELIIQAHQAILKKFPDALLILVPRHPERFDSVSSLVSATSLSWQRRSAAKPVKDEPSVYIGDTLGELLLMLAASDVAFVGGSLVSTGGHNPLEPAALGVPVITGPHWFNFAGVYPVLFDAGAAMEISDIEGLVNQVSDWFSSPQQRAHAGNEGRLVVRSNQGALARILEVLRAVLKD
jgi:3-deoxy-D-manno-octulosonic-acid transferase